MRDVSQRVDDRAARRINGERLVVLGWARAILMQVAHPLVAAGVADHSRFGVGGSAAVKRLFRTIAAMRSMTFGDRHARGETLASIRAIHHRVHGRLSRAAGPFPAGTCYSAEDPALLLWVHATLLDSLPLAYEHLVGPLSEADRDAFCAEAAGVAIELGARPDDVPRSWSDVRRYVDDMLASEVIVVSDQGRAVAAAVLAPSLTPFARPLLVLHQLITRGWLPPSLRDQYHLPWTDRDERRLLFALRAVRSARAALPRRIALWSDARGAGA